MWRRSARAAIILEHVGPTLTQDGPSPRPAEGKLSQSVARAERGERVVLARNGKPTVNLAPVTERDPDDVPEGLERTRTARSDFEGGQRSADGRRAGQR